MAQGREVEGVGVGGWSGGRSGYKMRFRVHKEVISQQKEMRRQLGIVRGKNKRKILYSRHKSYFTSNKK